MNSLERRACTIADPVARLRFLRGAMRDWAPKKRAARTWGSLPWTAGAVILALLGGSKPLSTAETFARERRLAIPEIPAMAPLPPPPEVWRIDRSEAVETYSNGLRVDLTFAVQNRPRERYPVFPLNGGSEPVRYATGPVGIVYHTTESNLAPFEAEQNRRLEHLGRNLLEVVRTERAYNYVIDRFGRVFRVVEESDAANHSGNSVWADANGIYVNLNASFLGVAFEAQTGSAEQVTEAQISAARMLTEMLRSRYSIAAEDCVTHAQVSVNPLNMHIGAHTDWAAQFPFTALGLPDNYSTPLASLYAFGFGYDDVFLRVIGARWKGLDAAEAQVNRQSEIEGLSPARYRAILQHRYKDIVSGFKDQVSEGGS